MSKAQRFLHYRAQRSLPSGKTEETLLHGQDDLLRYQETILLMTAGEQITIVAEPMICLACQRRANTAPTFICQMPEWAGPTGG